MLSAVFCKKSMNRNGTYLEMPKDQFAEILRECQLLIYPKPKTKEEEKKEKEARDKAAKSGLNHLEENKEDLFIENDVYQAISPV